MILLFLILTCVTWASTTKTGEDIIKPKITISSGIHLRPIGTVIYTSSPPIIYDLTYQFTELHTLVDNLAIVKQTPAFVNLTGAILQDLDTFHLRLEDIR